MGYLNEANTGWAEYDPSKKEDIFNDTGICTKIKYLDVPDPNDDSGQKKIPEVIIDMAELQEYIHMTQEALIIAYPILKKYLANDQGGGGFNAIITEEVKTAATDGRYIFFNPLFVWYLANMDCINGGGEANGFDSVDEGIMFVYLHEIYHCMFLHHLREEKYGNARKGGVDHNRANIVQDQEINSQLEGFSAFNEVFKNGKQVGITGALGVILFSNKPEVAGTWNSVDDETYEKLYNEPFTYQSEGEDGKMIDVECKYPTAFSCQWEAMYDWFEEHGWPDGMNKSLRDQIQEAMEKAQEEANKPIEGSQDEYDEGYYDAYRGNPMKPGKDKDYMAGFADGQKWLEYDKANNTCVNDPDYISGKEWAEQNGGDFNESIVIDFADFSTREELYESIQRCKDSGLLEGFKIVDRNSEAWKKAIEDYKKRQQASGSSSQQGSQKEHQQEEVQKRGNQDYQQSQNPQQNGQQDQSKQGSQKEQQEKVQKRGGQDQQQNQQQSQNPQQNGQQDQSKQGQNNDNKSGNNDNADKRGGNKSQEQNQGGQGEQEEQEGQEGQEHKGGSTPKDPRPGQAHQPGQPDPNGEKPQSGGGQEGNPEKDGSGTQGQENQGNATGNGNKSQQSQNGNSNSRGPIKRHEGNTVPGGKNPHGSGSKNNQQQKGQGNGNNNQQGQGNSQGGTQAGGTTEYVIRRKANADDFKWGEQRDQISTTEADDILRRTGRDPYDKGANSDAKWKNKVAKNGYEGMPGTASDPMIGDLRPEDMVNSTHGVGKGSGIYATMDRCFQAMKSSVNWQDLLMEYIKGAFKFNSMKINKRSLARDRDIVRRIERDYGGDSIGHVAFAIDNSGSMWGKGEAAFDKFFNEIAKIKEKIGRPIKAIVTWPFTAGEDHFLAEYWPDADVNPRRMNVEKNGGTDFSTIMKIMKVGNVFEKKSGRRIWQGIEDYADFPVVTVIMTDGEDSIPKRSTAWDTNEHCLIWFVINTNQGIINDFRKSLKQAGYDARYYIGITTDQI